MRLLRLPAVRDKTGLGTTKIYEGMSLGTFPQNFPNGERTVVWLESEIEEWIAAKVAARHEHAGFRPVTPRGARRNPPNPARKKTGGAHRSAR
jgi:prophage regulatory protein